MEVTENASLFVESACGERNKVKLQFQFGVCTCVVPACVRPSVRICPGNNLLMCTWIL